MKAATNFLRNADFFGTPFQQQINHKQSLYRSAIGGLFTLAIFSASLTYSIWILYQWQNNQFSPKISSSIYVSDFKLLDFDYDVIKIYFWKIDDSFIDPFEQNLLLIVVQQLQNDGQYVNTVLNFSTETTSDGNRFIVPNLNFGEQEQNGITYIASEMTILIVECSDDLLIDREQKCASQEKFDQFLSQPLNVLALQMQYRSLNSQNGEVQNNTQEYYVQLENNYCYTLNVFLQSTFYEVKDYFIYGESKFFEYINGASTQTQTNSINYCSVSYGFKIYGVIYATMQSNQVKSVYEYPHAGDLLANIGSIVSVLFMIKYIIIILNNYLLHETILHELIQIYYPQFKNVKVFKNWKRQPYKVTFDKKDVNLEEFLKFYNNIYQQVQAKLSFINLLYEISRLYLIIRSFTQKNEIKRSHQIGIRLKFISSSSDIFVDSGSKSNFSRFDISEQQQLQDDDFNLLSINIRNQLQNIDKIPDEISNNFDFYDINKLI